MEWTQERRERLETASLHVKGCPLAHAPNRLSSCMCFSDIGDALDEIDRLTARVEAQRVALKEAEDAFRTIYVTALPVDSVAAVNMGSVAKRGLKHVLSALTPPGEEPA